MNDHKFWKERVRDLKTEVQAMYLAYRDPRTPWLAKVITALVVAYALSPIDLIPDPIPILGYLDDLVLLPVGILLARKLIPDHVLADCRQRARQLQEEQPTNWWAAIAIVGIWLVLLVWGIHFALQVLKRPDTL